MKNWRMKIKALSRKYNLTGRETATPAFVDPPLSQHLSTILTFLSYHPRFFFFLPLIFLTSNFRAFFQLAFYYPRYDFSIYFRNIYNKENCLSLQFNNIFFLGSHPTICILSCLFSVFYSSLELLIIEGRERKRNDTFVA